MVMGSTYGTRCSQANPYCWLIPFTVLQATPLGSQPPPKVHEKVITWVEHHPTSSGDMLTASADGTVKIWRS